MFEDLLTECAVAVATTDGEGSGFFVAPGLVVTAAHVVVSSETCSVMWKGVQFQGNVLDRCPSVEGPSDPHPVPDVAVIGIVDAPEHPWVEFDQTVPRSDDRLFAVGYTRRYDTGRLSLTPFTYTSEGVLSVDGVDLVQTRDGLVVSGMSGAPVLNLRTGRVIGHLKRTGDERVPTGGWVVHCRSWLDRVFAVRERHETVRHRRWRDARLRRLEPHVQRALQTPPSGDFPPSAVLAPEYGLVDFIGREGSLADLHAWCEEDRDFDVRLLIGSGGVGKSRLAAEVCAQRDTAGWISGVLDPAAPETTLADVRATGDAALVVIDYAESRGDVVALLRRAAEVEEGARLRVLLLARGISEWWEDVREAPQRRVRDAVLRHPPTTLGTRLDEESRPEEIVADAVRCFARALSRPRPGVPTLPPEAVGWSVLSLHVWALLVVLAEMDTGVAPPATGAALWQELLGHEARYWRATARAVDLTALDMTTLRRCVGLVTLLGTTSEQETVRSLARVPELSDADELLRHRVARWLCTVYPGQPPEWLGRLAPDVLAEHHVVDQLIAAPEFARRALTALPADQSVYALTVLGRALAHRSEAETLISAALRVDLGGLALPALEAARRTGPALGRLLAAATASSASPLLIDELARRTPPRSEALRDLRILVLRRQRDVARIGSPDEIRLRIELGRLLVLVGEADEARHLAYTALEQLTSKASLGDRARAFLLQGEALTALGQRRQAVEANEKAVALFRKQFIADLSAGPVEFADALILRSHMLLDIEEPWAAEAAAREAIARLEARPASSSAWQLAMARVQVSLSHALWRTDRHEEDLASCRHAVATLRTLASLDSDQHLSELGTALDQLGVRLSELGEHEEAMAHTRDAVGIFRKLTRDNPALYSNLLAVGLNNLAVRFSEHDRAEEALEVIQEAVDLHRARVHNATNTAHLVRSLLNLGGYHKLLGHSDAALAAIEEAVRLARRIDTDGRFARDVGLALQTLASYTTEESPDTALELAEEAVALLRAARETHSKHGRSVLARALDTAVRIHIAREDLPAAIEVQEEAVKVWLELAEDAPQVSGIEAVHAVDKLLLLKQASGAPAVNVVDAERAAAWIVGAARRCAELAPDRATPVLVRALRANALQGSEAGRHEEALAAAAEAVALARGLEVNAELLAECLHVYGQALLAVDRLIEAIEVLSECVRMESAVDGGGAHIRRGMTANLVFLGKAELSIGRHASAAEHLSAAISRLTADTDTDRAALFEASDHCLQATATNGETRAAIASAVLALATSDGASENRVDACLETLCRVIERSPAAGTVWREIVGEDLPSMLAGIAHRPISAEDRDHDLVDIARRFAADAARVVADGERALTELRREAALSPVRLLLHAARIGLRRGLRRDDLPYPAGEQPRAGAVRDVGDRVRLTPYLAAAATWCPDIPAPGIESLRLVELAAPEDLTNIVAKAQATGLDDLAAAALARGVELSLPEAVHNLAYQLHRRGKTAEARALYEQAAALDVTESMITLASFIMHEDIDAAERLLCKAADRGHPRGMASLAGLLEVIGREPEARHWAQLAAEGGDAIGMHTFGRLEIEAGNPQGEYWLTAAAEHGSVNAMHALGERLLIKDPTKAADWLRKAALAGHLMAALKMWEHLKQQAKAIDDELVRWIADSRELVFGPHGGEILLPPQLNGYAHLMRVRSMLELSQRAIGRHDLHEAAVWLEHAVRAGIPPEFASIAEQVLGTLEEKHDLTDMWRALAEAGDGQAMYNLGLLFWRKDQMEDAEHWWRRGAAVGAVECYNKIGVVRHNAGDLDEADHWFRQGAEHGDPVAMFNAGALANERGAAEEAVSWFRRAHDAGHERAAEVLQQLTTDDA